MSRPMYNGRTARDWYHIWQEDTSALQKRLEKAQQELDAAEALLEKLRNPKAETVYEPDEYGDDPCLD